MQPRMIALLLFGLLGACEASDRSAHFVEAEVSAPTDRIMWRVTLISLDKVGFPPGAELDQATLTATSGWNMSLAPFKGDGYRERALVRIERLEGGRYFIEVRVQRERNDSLTNPLDPSMAEWKPESDNEERAKLIMQHIQSMLGSEIDVGRRPSERYTNP